jgi:hypothetical protein
MKIGTIYLYSFSSYIVSSALTLKFLLCMTKRKMKMKKIDIKSGIKQGRALSIFHYKVEIQEYRIYSVYQKNLKKH